MPDAVLLLRLLVASRVVDLHAITEVIRNDVGLAIQLFRLGAAERQGRPVGVLSLSDLAVQVGAEKLSVMASETGLNPLHSSNTSPNARERFWMRARITARISEELAGTSAGRAAAYAAGLMRQLGELPALLGWKLPGWTSASTGEIGYQLAKEWRLPAILADVVRGDERVCSSHKALSLLQLVNSAAERARRWETAGASGSSRITTAPMQN